MKRLFLLTYVTILILLAIFSWCFVDANFPLKTLPVLNQFLWLHRGLATATYGGFVALLFICYGYLLRLVNRKVVDLKYVLALILITIVILFFSFPAFAYDIFNYIATAKVAFLYRENPYVVMPIEIPNEPMLSFMHAANKVALYGFAWIALTGIPLALGLGNLIVTTVAFKGFIIVFYGILLWLIWQLSGKSIKALAFFALNPLVVLETLVSAHNDVVMMAFGLLAFFFFKKNKLKTAIFFLFLSIFIKLATLALIPVFIYLLYLKNIRQKINWDSIWKWSAIAMFVVFFLSPLREEIYSWYLIWPLVFVALSLKEKLLFWLTVGFSFGLPFRFAPYLYTGSWGGLTPFIKKIVTFVPPVLSAAYYEIRKKI